MFRVSYIENTNTREFQTVECDDLGDQLDKIKVRSGMVIIKNPTSDKINQHN